MLNKPKKTAVLFYNGIGNFIMATPFIYERVSHPEIVLLEDDYRKDEIASISLWPVRVVTREEAPKVAIEYDRAYVCWGYPTEILERVRGNEKVVFQKQPKWNTGVAEYASYFSMRPDATVPTKNLPYSTVSTHIKVVPSWNLYEGDYEHLVAIASGASPRLNWKNKRWPTEKLVEYAVKVSQKHGGVQFVFLGSKEEREIGEAICNAVGSKCWNFAGMFSFGESCDLLKQCAMLVTNDTAMMHAAGALSVPMLVLWSYSPISKNRPISSNVVSVLDTHGAGCPKYPCYAKKDMWECQNPVCVSSIPVDLVVDETWKVLGDSLPHFKHVRERKTPSNIQVAVDDYGENHWLKKKIYRNLTTKPWHASRIDAVCENMDGDEILDVACATGELTDKIRLAAKPRRIVGYEGCLEVIKHGREWYPQIEFIHGLVENMPFERKSFDAVHAGEIIEHVGDPEGFVRSIAEIARHKVVITTPKTVVEDPAHINIWTEPAFREMLAKQFESVQIINTDRCMVAVCEGPR